MTLASAGGPAMVLEVASGDGLDGALLSDAAPIIASRSAGLAAQSEGEFAASATQSQEMVAVIQTFARTVKQILDHDRLSFYLLTPDGRALERFAVASSPVVPGESTVLPFSEFGLRHILLTNQALVSEELGVDPRLPGREDRLIAQAGFKGLLSVPLRLDQKPFGVLNFVSRTRGFYRAEDMPVAQQIADQIGVFVDHLRTERAARLWTRRQVIDHERRRLAASLHGTLAQSLPAIAKGAENLAAKASAADDKAAAEAVAETAELALARVRRTLVGVVPAALESNALSDVIEGELRALEEQHGISAELAFDGGPASVPNIVRRGVYCVLQEALSNVSLHARARNVTVRLSISDDLEMSIQDDGVGCQGLLSEDRQTLGVSFMREEAKTMGGSLAVESSPGCGTTVSLVVPALRDTVEEPEHLPAPNGNTPSGVSVRILLAERRPLLREGIAHALSAVPEFRVVGTASTPDQLRSNTRRLRPDVVLLDDKIAQENMAVLIREIRRAAPATLVIALCEADHASWQDLIDAGASGVIRRHMLPDELIAAIRAVAAGSILLDGQADPEVRVARDRVALTPREQSILGLLAAGGTNAEIADTLCLATKTIERHVGTVVGKLGAKNRAHAAALGVSQRLVELPALPPRPQS